MYAAALNYKFFKDMSKMWISFMLTQYSALRKNANPIIFLIYSNKKIEGSSSLIKKIGRSHKISTLDFINFYWNLNTAAPLKNLRPL